MANQKEKLFNDFPSVTTEEWMAKITADLKGADFEKKLVWKTNEGFKVNPFYRGEDIEGMATTSSLPGEFPYVRGTKRDNNWFVRQDINVNDIKAANAKALDLLTKGVTSLGFNISSKLVNAENISTLLKGLNLETVEINFTTCKKATLELVKILTSYYKASNAKLIKCYGSVNYDPFKSILKVGIDNDNWIKEAVEIVKAASELPRFRVLHINAYKFSDAGSYIYQELGYALANGNQILEKLVKEGLTPVQVAKKIKFNFGIGSNYFMEIAKFRAARWLWAEIVSSYEAKCANNNCKNRTEDEECHCSAKIYMHAQTSTFNKTIFDAHVNLLRTQTEAMSATIAGVNSLSINPFDQFYQDSDDFSERIARNQQLLLKEECHFDKITDPSAGSYYIENLTSSIAKQAWQLFLQTDENGFYEEIKKGSVQAAIQVSTDARYGAAATRREILLGTNQYPNFTEQADAKIVVKNTSCECHENKGEYATLPTSRLAEEFEKLRLATEKAGAPKVFMLTIGNLGMRLARSQFSSNFFACAGYKVIDNLGFKTIEDGIKAARQQQADIIVLCSSDDEYATYAPQAHNILAKGKEHFVVAGMPACMDDLKALGIQHFINVKTNVLETLKIFNAKLGIN